MPRTEYDETFDADGNLIERTERVVNDPPPDPREQTVAVLNGSGSTAVKLAALAELIPQLGLDERT